MLSIDPPPEIVDGGEPAGLGLPQQLGVRWVRGGHDDDDGGGGCEARYAH